MTAATLLIRGPGARASLAERAAPAPSVVHDWLAAPAEPSAVPPELDAQLNAAAGVLAGATEALLVHVFEASRQYAFTVLHDHHNAVVAAGDASESANLSTPEALGAVIAQVAQVAASAPCVVTRLSLGRPGAPRAYDVRTFEFLTPAAPTQLVLMLTSLALGRLEPARHATGDWRAAPPGLEPGLQRIDLRTPSPLTDALLAPPGVVVLRHDDWDRGRAEGCALWADATIGWAYAWDNGQAHVGTDRGRMIERMLEEHAGASGDAIASVRRGSSRVNAGARLNDADAISRLLAAVSS